MSTVWNFFENAFLDKPLWHFYLDLLRASTVPLSCYIQGLKSIQRFEGTWKLWKNEKKESQKSVKQFFSLGKLFIFVRRLPTDAVLVKSQVLPFSVIEPRMVTAGQMWCQTFLFCLISKCNTMTGRGFCPRTFCLGNAQWRNVKNVLVARSLTAALLIVTHLITPDVAGRTAALCAFTNNQTLYRRSRDIVLNIWCVIFLASLSSIDRLAIVMLLLPYNRLQLFTAASNEQNMSCSFRSR